MGGRSIVSCVLLERPGKWRTIGVGLIFLAATLPALPLLWQVAASGSGWSLGGGFLGALSNSLLVALAASAVALLWGLPVGVLAALYEFPGRKILLALATLPVVVPSVLWTIGWSGLLVRLGPAAAKLIAGIPGCALIFFVTTFPLVMLVSYAACITLSGSQVDAARLAGGERSVFLHAIKYAATPALLAAGLGGVLILSDPGPGQILGLQTAASEIMTSFSALYDFGLAAQQCVTLTLIVLIFALPLARVAGPRIANEMLARQTHRVRRVRQKRMVSLTRAALMLFVLVGVMMPVLGLALPLLNGESFSRALSELSRTAGTTLFYAIGAGTIAMSLGFLLAFFVGRQNRLRAVTLGAAFAVFSLPPALSALGFVYLSADSPAWTDPILRSRITVCLALGLRFFPVAAVLGMRAWGSAPPSWALAAGVHGVPLGTYLRRVALPYMLPAAAVTVLLAALLATADIGTVLLLHPPGAASFPLAIFTIMANAPESLVASLSLIYMLIAVGLLAIVWATAGGQTK